MNRTVKYSLGVGSLLWLLIGCGELPAAVSTVSGTVSAPIGGDVAGTKVVACLDNARNCESFSVDITERGREADYRLEGLAPGAYGVYAVKDLNRNGVIDNGDYSGIHLEEDSERVALVRPPATDIDIQLVVLSGVTPVPLALLEAVEDSVADEPF